MFDVESMVRVVTTGEDTKFQLVIGSVGIGQEGPREEVDEAVKRLRSWLERQLMGAYARYSAELRDRLRWRTGVGAAETMEQVYRLAVDLDEVRGDNFDLKAKIEALESELISLREMYRYKFQEHSNAIKELMGANQTIEQHRRVLRTIADSSSDQASRLAAKGILYTEGS